MDTPPPYLLSRPTPTPRGIGRFKCVSAETFGPRIVAGQRGRDLGSFTYRVGPGCEVSLLLVAGPFRNTARNRGVKFTPPRHQGQ